MDAVDSPEGEEVNDNDLALEVCQLEGLAVQPFAHLREFRCGNVKLGRLTSEHGDKHDG